VRSTLAGMGYDVRVNDPYKGVELVRAYSNPAEGRMSLQLEINKRLYMDEAARAKNADFQTLQRQLLELVDAVLDYTESALRTEARGR
jgi:N-formylglutamate amidohydrolase